LRRVFEGVVAICIAAGLVGGEAFSIDASLIKADVNKMKRLPGDQPIAWPKAEEASHAVREYIAALDAASGDEDSGEDGGGSSEGGHRRKPPKEVSLTDPQATWVEPCAKEAGKSTAAMRHCLATIGGQTLRPADLAPEVSLTGKGLRNAAALFLPED